MKMKTLRVLLILLAVVLAASLIGPPIILSAVRQPEPAANYAYSESFYDSYEQIRDHLQELTDAVATALLPQQRTAEQIRREIRQTKRHLERLEHELAEIVEQARKEDGTPSS